jgi:hypothetical protein
VAVERKRWVIVACLGEQADGFEGDAVEPLLDRARFVCPDVESVEPTPASPLSVSGGRPSGAAAGPAHYDLAGRWRADRTRTLRPRGVVRHVVAALLERCAVDGVDVPLRIGRRADLDVVATELDQPIDECSRVRRATSRMKSSEVG